MFRFPWSRKPSRNVPYRKPARRRLTVEALEERTLLAVSVLSSAATLSDTAAGNVYNPASVSKDGRYVVYTDTAANLSASQSMNSKTASDVFLFDRSTGTTTLVSHAYNSTTTTADGASKNAVISADGKWIAYVSNSDNLVQGETLADDTYSLTVQGYSGGTFALTYGGNTATLQSTAMASDVQAALEKLPGIGTGNVSVTGGNGEPFTITFTGALANAASSPLTADGSGLTTSDPFSSGNFVFLGGHNEFLCDQYWVFLYNVQTGATTLVSHVASDQGANYQTTVSEGTSGILTGTQGGDTSFASQTTSVSISGDGSSVVYLSTGGHLVAGEQQGSVNITNPPLGTRANVFVYDRSSDTNYLVSRQCDQTTGVLSSTTPGDNTSYVAVIDQNGDTIAFGSQSANLVKGEQVNNANGDITGETEQFFVAKMSGSTWANETIALASHDLNGTNFESLTNVSSIPDYPAPVLTPDGHWLVYQSDNSILQNVSTIFAPTGDNYYLYDTTSPNSVSNNTLVSHIPGDSTLSGNAGPTFSATTTAPSATISDNGQYVAFVSAATNLTSSGTSAGYNVYLFNRLGTVDGTHNNVTLITHKSIPSTSVPATTWPPLAPSISGDGTYVAYVGFATADISGLTNVNTLPGSKGLDAEVYNTGTGTYTLLSHAYSSTTTTGTGEAYSPVVSEDGSTVLYLDDSDNLLPTTINGHTGQDLNAALPTDGTDLYAYNLNKPSYPVVAGNDDTDTAPVGSNSTVTLRDPNLPSNTANGLSEISPVHAVSSDGNFTVFISNAPNLVANEVDSNLTQNVYLYSKATGAVTLLSHATGASATTANGESANAVISGDGKTVLFYSYATNLISGETFSGTAGKDPELYLYDNDPSHNGQNGQPNTYQTLQLVSHTSGNDSQAANGTSPRTPNGVVPGYSSLLYSNVSLLAGATGLALPSISDNGQYIAYLSNATNLSGSNTGTATLDAFLYDRGADTNTMISHASGVTTTANKATDTVAISADGSTVAFTSKATNLLSSSITTSGDQLYVWSRINNTSVTGLSAGQTVLASHQSGANTTAASFRSYTDPNTGLPTSTATSPWGPVPASLSSNGAYIAYYFGGSNLVSTTADAHAAADNVFRYDVKNNSNTLVSHANSSSTTSGDNPTNANQYEASGPAISSDGRYIAYANNSTNLLASALTGPNGQDNVYLFDANQTDATKQNTLVSHASGANGATTPDTNGGTAPSISSDGRYVSFIDLALNNTADVNCTFPDTASVRLFDAQATATTQPTKIGDAFDPTTMLLVGATLAPTELSGDGSTLAWNGLASGNVSGDLNGNLDVFETTLGLSMTTNPISVPEGTVYTGTLATVTDTNTADTSGSFNATIDWGDNTTTTGTVTGSNGTFTITDGGNHTYADEGTGTFTVKVTHGTDTLQGSNTATVTENDTLTGSKATITATEGTAYTGTVATFTTTYTANTASDFTASIDWGDGTTTNGTVTGSNGSFTVTAGSSGGHAYADEGTQTVTVTIKDEAPGTASVVVKSTATVGEGDTLTAQATTLSNVAEGTNVGNVQVATFTSTYTANPASDFVATVDWGDGTVTTGTVTGSNGSFAVSVSGANSHTYADEGTYTVTTTISDDTPGTATKTVQTTITVTEADTLTAQATALSSVAEGTTVVNVQVATFTSTYTANTASDFVATVDWGDGTVTAGTITGSNGSFTVSANDPNGHAYADEGTYTVTTTISDDTPGTASKSVQTSITVTESDQLQAAGVQAQSFAEGTGIGANALVATFTSTYLGNVAADFSATIDWGDGSPLDTGVVAAVAGKPGNYTVSTTANGGHIYTDELTSNIVVTINDDTPGTATATAKTAVTVTEADQLQAAGVQAQSFAEGTGVGANTLVATFTTTYLANTAADFTATIDWGDGSPVDTGVVAAVAGQPGSYTVSTVANGGHTYTDELAGTITVTISDDAPGTATAVAQTQVAVTEADQLQAAGVQAVNVAEGNGIAANALVATFTSTYLANTAADFTATIDWGDGSPVNTGVVAAVAGQPGSYTVKTAANGGHTYADELNSTITVTIKDDQPGTATATAQTTVTVTEADQLQAAGVQVQSFAEGTGIGANTLVATFTTTYLGNTAADFSAAIDWGDGSAPDAGVVAAVAGQPGSYTVSTASGHTYADELAGTITVSISDDQPGTATAVAQTPVTVTEADQLQAAGVQAVSVAEGTGIGGNTLVATFTTTYLNNTAADFSATIDWGDGSAPDAGTVAAVAGQPGSYTVSTASSHTYADELVGTITVTISDDDPGTAIAVAQTPVTVTEADTLTAQATALGSVAEGTSVGNVQMATFTSSYAANTKDDFTATLDWGDGTITTGTITAGTGANAGKFVVSASGANSHTYADEGSYTVTTTISDDAPGTASTSVQTTLTVTESDQLQAAGLQAQSFPEGNGVGANALVATFTSTYLGNVAADFTAAIDWGDGSPLDAGIVAAVAGKPGSYTVKTAANGGHTYADELAGTITVTISDDAPGTATAVAQTAVTVTEADQLQALGVQAVNVAEGNGVAANATVATFTSSYLGNVAADFTATIDWGDGTTTAGTIAAGTLAGSYVVTTAAGHTYTDELNSTITVTISDDAPGTATATAQTAVTVTEADTLSATATALSSVAEGSSVGNVQLATFTSTYTANPAADFVATVDWGDGTTTTGTVTGSNGSFTVSVSGANSHTYADEGTYTVTTTITDDTPGTATTSVQATVTATEADILNATATALASVAEGASLGNVQVATFTSSYAANTKDDFTATLDWGDGTITTGTITVGTGANAGKFVVSANDPNSHAYADEGSYTVTTTIKDDTPGTASKSVQTTITVTENDTLAAVGVNSFNLQAGQGIGSNVQLATFTTNYSGNFTVGDFTATIDWGDGSPVSTGTVTAVAGKPGNYTVTTASGHTYTDKLASNITVTISDDNPGTATATAQTPITVNPAPPTDISLSNSSVTAYRAAGTVIGTLSTTDPNAGQTFSYSLSGANASLFQVVGDQLETNTVFQLTTQTLYSVTVKTTDTLGLSDSKTFTITVNPSTAAPTDISLSNSTVTAYRAAGTVIGTLSTTDPNVDQTFSYTLSGANASLFQVVGDQLETNAVFQTTTQTSYSITVKTTDTLGLSDSKTFTITVNPSTASPTDITLSNSSVAAAQPTATVVGTLSTTDPNVGQTFSYSLSGANAGLFTVDNSTGTLETNTVFQLTTQTSYSLDVQTTDSLGLSLTKTFTITVNPAPPTDISLSNSSVTAYRAAGTAIGTLSTTDPNAGQTFSYTLSGANASLFQVVGDQLETNTVFQTTTQTSYSLDVQTTDSLGLSDSKTFTITVNPSTAAPTDISLSNSSVTAYRAAGTVIGTLSTTDPNVDQAFSYTLSGANASLFTVDNGTGTLETNTVFQTTTQTSYSLDVQTTDSLGLSLTRTFTITVNPSTASPTDISLSNSSVTAAQPVGTVVGTLSTTDPNVDQTFSYTLTDDAKGQFKLDGSTLETNTVFAVGAATTYSVTVQSTDTLGLSIAKSFTITVNPASPSNITLSNSSVTAGQPAGTPVGMLSTSDPNAGQSFTYAVLTNSNLFTVDNSTGTLQTASTLPASGPASYSVTIRSTDSLGLTVDKTFVISVTAPVPAQTSNGGGNSTPSSNATPAVTTSTSGSQGTTGNTASTVTTVSDSGNLRPGTAITMISANPNTTSSTTTSTNTSPGASSTPTTAAPTIISADSGPTVNTSTSNPVTTTNTSPSAMSAVTPATSSVTNPNPSGSSTTPASITILGVTVPLTPNPTPSMDNMEEESSFEATPLEDVSTPAEDGQDSPDLLDEVGDTDEE
jgi:hypothetical protein